MAAHPGDVSSSMSQMRRTMPQATEIPGNFGKSDIWKAQRREAAIMLINGVTTPNQVIDTPMLNWSPNSCMVYNFTNQFILQPDAKIWIPPASIMGPFPLPEGVGAMRIAVSQPPTVAQAALKLGQQVTAWFFEQETTGPFVAFSFTGP